MNVHLALVYRNATGVLKGKAVARNVRVTKTLYVIEPAMVEITEGKIKFGGERRYRRDSLAPYPKWNPFSGNGGWRIEAVITESMRQ